MDILEAAKSGNRKATLVALRDSIAETIAAKPSGRDLAALSRRLLEVMAELDRVAETERSEFDDVLGDL